MAGKEEINPSKAIKLYWPSAKEKLGEVIEDSFNKARNQDKRFAQETKTGDLNLRGFIYELGQKSTALNDFPQVIEIAIGTCSLLQEEEEDLQIKMPFSDLLSQLTQIITKFVCSHKIRKQYPNAFQNEINALNCLTNNVSGKKVELDFSQTFQKDVYGLNSIKVVKVI